MGSHSGFVGDSRLFDVNLWPRANVSRYFERNVGRSSSHTTWIQRICLSVHSLNQTRMSVLGIQIYRGTKWCTEENSGNAWNFTNTESTRTILTDKYERNNWIQQTNTNETTELKRQIRTKQLNSTNKNKTTEFNRQIRTKQLNWKDKYERKNWIQQIRTKQLNSTDKYERNSWIEKTNTNEKTEFNK